MIKKDKLKAETSPKEKENTKIIEDVDNLKFMFNSLCRIFNTRSQHEILQKAEMMQNNEGMNSDYVKF